MARAERVASPVDREVASPGEREVASPTRGERVASPVEESARGLICSLAQLNVRQAVYATPSHSSLRSPEQEFTSKCREFELEIEKISSHVEHLKAGNAVLALSLEESKETCDSLTELLGRYESNNTALQISLSYCDHMIESYDVLVALMETEVEEQGRGRRGEEGRGRSSHRSAAERVARHLLGRLERGGGQGRDSGLGRLGDTWEEVSSGYSHTNSSTSTSSSGMEQDFSKLDEQRLRDHIGKLKVSLAWIFLLVQ